jgi:hypothetical protein
MAAVISVFAVAPEASILRSHKYHVFVTTVGPTAVRPMFPFETAKRPVPGSYWNKPALAGPLNAAIVTTAPGSDANRT